MKYENARWSPSNLTILYIANLIDGSTPLLVYNPTAAGPYPVTALNRICIVSVVDACADKVWASHRIRN